MTKKRILSFRYALEGILIALKDEPNFIIHLAAALVVFVLGIYFEITVFEWIAVIFAIGLVISVELTNTAIEEVVDSFTQEAHPGAKKAKDVAAGAVLVVSITALMIGILIFLPYISR